MHDSESLAMTAGVTLLAHCESSAVTVGVTPMADCECCAVTAGGTAAADSDTHAGAGRFSQRGAATA